MKHYVARKQECAVQNFHTFAKPSCMSKPILGWCLARVPPQSENQENKFNLVPRCSHITITPCPKDHTSWFTPDRQSIQLANRKYAMDYLFASRRYWFKGSISRLNGADKRYVWSRGRRGFSLHLCYVMMWGRKTAGES